MLARIRNQPSSQRCGATGNQGVSGSPHLRPMGLPRNPLACDIFQALRTALVCHQQPARSCSALVLDPKERLLWLTGAHRGARGTLDEFKTAWGGRPAHDGGLPKILRGNLVPAAVADRRIGLPPYAPRGRGWLICNLTYMTDRHTILQEVEARHGLGVKMPTEGRPVVGARSHRIRHLSYTPFSGAHIPVVWLGTAPVPLSQGRGQRLPRRFPHPCPLRGSPARWQGGLCPCPTTQSVEEGTGPCHKGTVKEL